MKGNVGVKPLEVQLLIMEEQHAHLKLETTMIWFESNVDLHLMLAAHSYLGKKEENLSMIKAIYTVSTLSQNKATGRKGKGASQVKSKGGLK